MRLTAVIVLGLVTTLPGFAGDPSVSQKYEPLFRVDMAYAIGTVAATYMKAYRSQTLDAATKAWETFLKDYEDDPSIEDLTDLTLVRQAYYELMRLYYIKGRNAEADKLLRKANELVVYSVPEASEATTWCRSRGYCQ